MQKVAALALLLVTSVFAGNAKADIVIYDIFINNVSGSASSPTFTASDVGEINGCDRDYDPNAGFAGCFGGDFDSSSSIYSDGTITEFDFADVNSFFLELFFQGAWISWAAGDSGLVAFDDTFRVHTFSYLRQSQELSLDITYSEDDVNDNGVEATVDNTDYTADVSFEARVDANAVPEPAGIFAIAIGLLAMISLRRKV